MFNIDNFNLFKKLFAQPDHLSLSSILFQIIFILGSSSSAATEKNIMIVGATGSGKSTLINAMANYVMGVTWEDPFRFTLVNVETSEESRAGNQVIFLKKMDIIKGY